MPEDTSELQLVLSILVAWKDGDGANKSAGSERP